MQFNTYLWLCQQKISRILIHSSQKPPCGANSIYLVGADAHIRPVQRSLKAINCRRRAGPWSRRAECRCPVTAGASPRPTMKKKYTVGEATEIGILIELIQSSQKPPFFALLQTLPARMEPLPCQISPLDPNNHRFPFAAFFTQIQIWYTYIKYTSLSIAQIHLKIYLN